MASSLRAAALAIAALVCIGDASAQGSSSRRDHCVAVGRHQLQERQTGEPAYWLVSVGNTCNDPIHIRTCSADGVRCDVKRVSAGGKAIFKNSFHQSDFSATLAR